MIAKEAGLHKIAEKKESMGICFVGKREFQDFISEVKEYMFVIEQNVLHINFNKIY